MPDLYVVDPIACHKFSAAKLISVGQKKALIYMYVPVGIHIFQNYFIGTDAHDVILKDTTMDKSATVID